MDKNEKELTRRITAGIQEAVRRALLEEEIRARVVKEMEREKRKKKDS